MSDNAQCVSSTCCVEFKIEKQKKKIQIKNMRNNVQQSLLFMFILWFCQCLQSSIIRPMWLNHIKNEELVETKFNNTLWLHSPLDYANGTSVQNILLLRMIMHAMKASAKRFGANGTQAQTPLHLKMYGEGVEHKFPPFLERIVQRIQTYFSVYKYTDTSQSWPPAMGTTMIYAPTPTTLPTTTLPPPTTKNNSQLAYDYDYVEVNATTMKEE